MSCPVQPASCLASMQEITSPGQCIHLQDLRVCMFLEPLAGLPCQVIAHRSEGAKNQDLRQDECLRIFTTQCDLASLSTCEFQGLRLHTRVRVKPCSASPGGFDQPLHFVVYIFRQVSKIKLRIPWTYRVDLQIIRLTIMSNRHCLFHTFQGRIWSMSLPSKICGGANSLEISYSGLEDHLLLEPNRQFGQRIFVNEDPAALRTWSTMCRA